MRWSDLGHATWRKSGRSNGDVEGNCLEVTELVDQVVMRDSKNPTGPVLVLPRAQWRTFLDGLRTGQLP